MGKVEIKHKKLNPIVMRMLNKTDVIRFII